MSLSPRIDSMLLQQLFLRFQRAQHVEVRPGEDVPYLRQREAELPEEQHLLEPQGRVRPVLPVAVATAVRLHQADLVVVVERAHADACRLRQLPDRECFHV
jgi:hypothetical protein